MKDTQHTPGPWHVKEQYRSETTMQPPYWDVCTRREDGRDTIFETVAENCNLEDARLIAAAPDLLNLMTAATRLDELTGENLAVYARTFAALALAAIARATGNQ